MELRAESAALSAPAFDEYPGAFRERSAGGGGLDGRARPRRLGLYPNYFIQEPSETAPSQRRMVFNGRSHREILEDSFWGESWSSAAMSFADVQALLGRLRERKKKR